MNSVYKFKKGDRVRLLVGSDTVTVARYVRGVRKPIAAGTLGTVDENNSTSPFVLFVDMPTKWGCVNQKDLELIPHDQATPAPAPTPKKFRVGMWVRIVGPDTPGRSMPIGHEAQITELTFEGTNRLVSLLDNRGMTGGMSADRLEDGTVIEIPEPRREKHKEPMQTPS